MQNKSKSMREIWVDVFKAFAIYLIVLGHMLASTDALSVFLYAFHVPAFFFLSGYVFKNKESILNFLKKKALKLLLPYFIVGLISILIYFLLGQFASSELDTAISSTDIGKNILGLLYGNGRTGYMKWNLPLWYIPCLFMCLLVYWCFNWLINRISKNPLILKFGLFIVLLSFAFISYYCFNIPPLFFGLEGCIFYLPFVVLGNVSKDLKEKTNFNLKTNLLISIPTILLASTVLFLFNNQRADYVGYAFHNVFLFYLIAFMLIIGFMFLFKLVSKETIISKIGSSTLFILLFHKFPIVFFQILLKSIFENIYIKILICIVLSVGIVFALYYCDVLYLYVRFKLTNRLFKKTKTRDAK